MIISTEAKHFSNICRSRPKTTIPLGLGNHSVILYRQCCL